jgi:hypothetical protein
MNLPGHAARTGPQHPIPAPMRARLRDVPAVVRVSSRAFTAGRWPRRLHPAWALSQHWMQIPVATAAVLGGRAAISPDRTAVVVVTTSRWDAVVLLAVGCLWVAIAAAIIRGVADLVVAVADPVTGPVGVVAALGLLTVLVVAPIVLDIVVLLTGRIRAGAVSPERYTARLRGLGLTAWAVGPWAAWPPHRGAGRALVDQLLPAVPDHVWLVAVARTPKVAEHLHRRGFITPEEGGLLCVRPAAGNTLTPPPARRPVRPDRP